MFECLKIIASELKKAGNSMCNSICEGFHESKLYDPNNRKEVKKECESLKSNINSVKNNFKW